MGTNDPYASRASGCIEAIAVGSALTKSSVIRDCVDDTDINEIARLRMRGLGRMDSSQLDV